jgi:hypothetical protein
MNKTHFLYVGTAGGAITIIILGALFLNYTNSISVTSDIKTAIDSLRNGNSKDAIMHLNQAVGHFSK